VGIACGRSCVYPGAFAGMRALLGRSNDPEVTIQRFSGFGLWLSRPAAQPVVVEALPQRFRE